MPRAPRKVISADEIAAKATRGGKRDSVRAQVWLCAVAGTILTLFGQGANAVSVPVVGCASDGQTGPLDAPEDATGTFAIDESAARALAYYKSPQGLGVLGPRGWHCFGTYGSSGDTLFVSPDPISPGAIKFTGAAIQAYRRLGDTSGRFAVAQTIARVFPAFRPFAMDVMKEGLDTSFVFGPYPKDVLTYKSAALVEYRTPPQTEGLGTASFLEKNGSPIDGVAMLVGEPPNLWFLAARLPVNRTKLAPIIVRQFERDAAAGVP